MLIRDYENGQDEEEATRDGHRRNVSAVSSCHTLWRRRHRIIPSTGTHKAPLCSPTEPLSVDSRRAACRPRSYGL